MFGSAILEVAIGLIFIYTVLSVVCSMIQERIAQIFSWRAQMLEEGIGRVLLDSDIRDRFYAHPLIKSLGRSRGKGKDARMVHPAYIPSQTFTTVVWDVVNTLVSEKSAAQGQSGEAMTAPAPDVAPAPDAGENIDPMVEAYQEVLAITRELPEGDFRIAMLAFLRASGNRVDTFKKNVDDWFDDSMDRVSSWYKQRAQLVVLILALILSVAGNIDSIELAEALWSEPATRQGLVALAEGYAEGEEGQLSDVDAVKEVEEQLMALELPFGWAGDPPQGPAAILSKILGLLLTTFAVSLGAPFWFDLLKKAVRLSGSYRTPSPPGQDGMPAKG